MSVQDLPKPRRISTLVRMASAWLIVLLIVGTAFSLKPAGIAVAATPSSTVLTADPESVSVFGQPVTFTAVVSPEPATGTVTFDNGGTVISGCASVPLASDNTASCTISSLTLGSPNITATYSGDSNYSLSFSTLPYEVDQADAVVTLIGTTPPSPVTNQSFTFNVKVIAAPPGGGVPTGSVQVLEDSDLLCTINLTNGAGSCSHTYISSAVHILTLTYSGDANFNSNDGSAALNISDTSSTNTLAATPSSPAIFGVPVTITSTIAPPGATGLVFFSDGGFPLLDCSLIFLDENNAAVCPLAAFAPGDHSITTFYGGDDTYSSSFSNTVNFTVIKANSTTVLTNTNPASPVVNQSVDFNFAVTANLPSLATPTGTVEVREGSTTLCSAAVEDGFCSYTFTTAGIHNLTIQYFGDAGFNISSAISSLNIESISSATALSVDPGSPAVFGQPVNFTASVSPSGATGQVDFADGGMPLAGCSGMSLSSGQAICSPLSLAVGSHSITAFYSGDSTYSSSQSSDPILFQVNPAGTLTAITTNLTHFSLINQPVLVAVSVNEISPSITSPTGSVIIGDGVVSCTATVTSQAASCSLTFTTPGVKAITASYHDPDGNFQDSSSASANHTVFAALIYNPIIKK